MKKAQRKLNMVKVKACLGGLLILLLTVIIIILSNITKEPKMSILYNNEEIELQKEVIIDADTIYFSKKDVQELFDNTIYYNEVEKELITTNEANIALLKLDEHKAEINDEEVEIKGNLKLINDEIYIPISSLASVYNIDLSYVKTLNRIIMDSTLIEKTEGQLKKKVKLKSSKGIFGKTLEKIIVGEKVTILEETGKYSKVKTPNGFIGYIKTKHMTNITKVREFDKVELLKLNVLRNYSNVNGVYGEVTSKVEGKQNVVTPTFFYLEKGSKVIDSVNSSTAAYSIYIKWVDENMLSILPTFKNNDTVSGNLLSYSQRKDVSNMITKMLLEHDFNTVNIQFDSIDDINSFYRFIIELTPRLKAAGIRIAVTINNNIDKTRISNIVDYCVEF